MAVSPCLEVSSIVNVIDDYLLMNLTGFTLYDTQKILNHARAAERGLMKRDPVNESISLTLDFLNIFIRMVQILGMQQRRK